MSASEDHTVKLWVFSAIHSSSLNGSNGDGDEDGGTLNDILCIDDGDISFMACQNDRTVNDDCYQALD